MKTGIHQAGSNTVDPIRTLEDIECVKRILAIKPRYLLLFITGINSAIRVSELLNLRVQDFQNKQSGETVYVSNPKNKNFNTLLFNESISNAFRFFCNVYAPHPQEYLFCKRNKLQPIRSEYAHYLVKTWCAQCNISGNFGAQSLRKSFGFIQRVYFGADLKYLCSLYNHKSTIETQKYLGLDTNHDFSFRAL